jgi:catechol 2,3-dioxygenase-like lactoylglutathione lyase family enzyme
MRFLFASLLLPGLLPAQLPAPNSMGVAMGHLHLNTKDPEAARRFWVEFMGAPATAKLADNDIYKFPEVLVFVRKSDKLGASEGSAVNHLGFKVKSLDAYLARAEKMGVPVVRRMPETRQAFVMNPDQVKVELSEDASMSAPVAHHHIHFFNTAHMETRAWYAKMFGAIPGRRGKFDAADLPGVNLTFSIAEQPVVPTKGRSMDHIGFEVKGLELFAKKMEAAGVKFDVPYRHVPKLGLSIAFFTDPWGTYVELTEGLGKF